MTARTTEYFQRYLDSQLKAAPGREAKPRPFVTISRQTGAGGITIGEKLAVYLAAHDGCGGCAWAVFDRDLVEKVMEEHRLPERVRPFLKEDKISELQDILDELFGIHPPEWALAKKTADTILHLAGLGHAVLVGRGANVVTRKLEEGFHVRLVAPMEVRLRHVQEYFRLGAAEAANLIRTEDAGREHYLKAYFGQRIDDPLLYDLVLNTERVSYDEAAALIGQAVIQRLHRQKVAASAARPV
jgi:cytidylate kinase